MRLPEMLNERLATEFRTAVGRMQAEQHPGRKLYFFSAMHSEAGRILNWVWDRELALIHNVLQDTHQRLSSRVETMLSGRETPVRFPLRVFDLLCEAASDMADFVEKQGKEQDLCDLLSRFAELGYAATGNGNYLMEKGLLNLPETT